MKISEHALDGDDLAALTIEDKVFVSSEYLAPATGVETEWRQDPRSSYFATVVGGVDPRDFLWDKDRQASFSGGVTVLRDPEEGASTKDVAQNIYPAQYIKPFVRVETYEQQNPDGTLEHLGQIITRRTIRLAKPASEA